MRAAVERSLERDDLPSPRRGLAELERRVDGVGSRRSAELDLHVVLHALRQERELERHELVLELGGEVEAVAENAQLPLHGLDDLGMVVAEGEHARAGQEVDEDVAVDILDVRPLRSTDCDRQAPRVRARVRFPFRLAFEQDTRSRPGERARDARVCQLAHAAPASSCRPDIFANAT